MLLGSFAGLVIVLLAGHYFLVRQCENAGDGKQPLELNKLAKVIFYAALIILMWLDTLLVSKLGIFAGVIFIVALMFAEVYLDKHDRPATVWVVLAEIGLTVLAVSIARIQTFKGNLVFLLLAVLGIIMTIMVWTFFYCGNTEEKKEEVKQKKAEAKAKIDEHKAQRQAKTEAKKAEKAEKAEAKKAEQAEKAEAKQERAEAKEAESAERAAARAKIKEAEQANETRGTEVTVTETESEHDAQVTLWQKIAGCAIVAACFVGVVTYYALVFVREFPSLDITNFFTR